MEQNNNAASTPVASSSTAQTNVAPVTPQDSPSKMSSPKDDVVFADKPKSNGMLLGMILLGILAVGGIGFGAWAMMDGNAQKEVLNTQIDALKQQNDELQEKLSSVAVATIDKDVDASDVNAGDYIYVGGWGLKIKIPEELKNVSYNIDDNKFYGNMLCVSGVANGATEDAEFADLSRNYPGLGCIYRVKHGAEWSQLGTVAFSDDDYDYIFSGSQAVYSTTEEMKTLENQSRSLVSDMLRNQDNYSKF